MSLPKYDKTQRKTTFEVLPKDAYVVKIIGAKEDKWPSGDPFLNIAFDIAEGKYKNYYAQMFERNTNEDKKWPIDGTFPLNIPTDGCKQYIWDNYNTFFADLEDSNNGFVFSGDVKTLKGKLIGGKFHIVQREYNGEVYDHTKLKWTCVAEDVRQGKAGKLPNDKLVEKKISPTDAAAAIDGFLSIPDEINEEVPF